VACQADLAPAARPERPHDPVPSQQMPAPSRSGTLTIRYPVPPNRCRHGSQDLAPAYYALLPKSDFGLRSLNFVG
jgi:hypothetical protein